MNSFFKLTMVLTSKVWFKNLYQDICEHSGLSSACNKVIPYVFLNIGGYLAEWSVLRSSDHVVTILIWGYKSVTVTVMETIN